MFRGTLLPYQVSAVEMMVDRKKVLVAYDLGLGKTVITIAAIEELRMTNQLSGPTLVVCLSSLKYQWAKEIAKFSNSTSIVVDGNCSQRKSQYKQYTDFDYVIVNYEQVVNDWDDVSTLSFGSLVMDEVTSIKSFRAKRSKKVKEMSRTLDIRFGLTGTPIENGRVEEVYSIMQAIDPDVLGKRFDLFDATFIVRNKFGGVERYRNLSQLHKRLKTACVRKSQTDPDVAPFLPDTIIKDPVLVPFDRFSASLYRTIVAHLQEELSEAQSLFGPSWSIDAHYGQGRGHNQGPGDALRGSIMSKVTALRMLCDHPVLLLHSADAYGPFTVEGSQYLSELFEDEALRNRALKARSPKLAVTVSMVKDHLDADSENKLVVFCSYVKMASMIHAESGGVLYTGRMNAKEKEDAKVQFQTDPLTRVLVSTDAGGYGVDLPQANLLINYDLPWSSGLATQRNGRIKRASSKWPSIIIENVLMSESIEERQFMVLQQKSAVASAVVDGKGINDRGGLDLTASSLMAFLHENTP